MKPRSRSYSFNVVLSTADRDKLNQLKRHLFLPRGAVFRQLLRAAHAMVLEGKPTCVDGSRCFVPQMHRNEPAPILDETTKED